MQLGLHQELATTDRARFVPVYNERRFSHTWVVGKTGYGKSTALINWAIEDILDGFGVAFFDPHGDAVETLLEHIPENRHSDVVLFDLGDRNYPVGFNPLHGVIAQERPRVASTIVDAFKSIWGTSWGPQLEQFLYNGVAALLEVPDGTLVGLKLLLTHAQFRRRVMASVTDPVIRDFWETDFEEHMPEREQRERTLSTLNKIGALISDPRIRNVIGQPASAINLRSLIDNNKILLISLPQGKLGIQKSALIGSLLMSQLHLAALGRRSDKPFHIFADEAHHFGTITLEEMLSGIRKRGVSLTLAHQYLDQLTPSLQSALLGTVNTLVSFRIGVKDAEILRPEFLLPANDNSLLSLRDQTTFVRTGTQTWSLTMRSIHHPRDLSAPSAIRRFSRRTYSHQRSQVEKRLSRFFENY